MGLAGLYFFSFKNNQMPMTKFITPTIANSIGRLTLTRVKQTIEKIAEPTINTAFKILLAPIMRARLVSGE